MKRSVFISCLLTVLIFNAARAADAAENFDATTEIVGHETNGMETPVNQLVTPAGILVSLPGMRPNALALSPDGKLLVTSGLLHELAAVDPATGKIFQRAPFPEEKQGESVEAVSPLILGAKKTAKLSFTGLTFSPDGKRIYLSNVNGDIKVFGVGKDQKISPLFSIPLPKANMPGRKNDIPTGIAVSPDGKKLYIALNVANQLAELDEASGKILRTWDAGVAPYGVVLCRNKI
jgi:DNA-binding beta-propeller fold protein YncE